MAGTKRKVCVVTSSRSDYARLKTVLKALQERDDVELSIVAAGTHLLSLYGHTVDNIERDGFTVSYRVYTEVEGRVLATMTKSTGLAIVEFSSYFANHRPDLVVVHGDRFEAFAAATAASMMNIHVAHVQGGEITGTIDEHLRHAITKLSHFHFPSDEDSKKRIIQLGELPERVFNAGCPSVDVLLSAPKMTFAELRLALDPFVKKKEWLRELDEDFILVAQHPVTTEFDETGRGIQATLDALSEFPNKLLVMWPNIDAGSEQIVRAIKEFERVEDGRVGVMSHIPMEVFINIMRHARVMVGNSSAGVREACYFGTPVVNIGSRQEGRMVSQNVVNVPDDRTAIAAAIKKQLALKERYAPTMPYGEGNSGTKIAELLATVTLGSPQKRLVSSV